MKTNVEERYEKLKMFEENFVKILKTYSLYLTCTHSHCTLICVASLFKYFSFC